MSELWQLSAREAVALLRRGEVTPGELVEVALARIEATDGALNALPTLCPERARQAPLQNAAEKGEEPGWLAGLPLAIKDLVEVAGVRTTFASPIHADNVPQESNILVERLEANGAGVLAKSNTPEFGAGAQTFNEVFSTTTNPWNTALTCGSYRNCSGIPASRQRKCTRTSPANASRPSTSNTTRAGEPHLRHGTAF